MTPFDGLTVVVINLPRRTDRLAAFCGRWRAAAPSLVGHPLDVQVHKAIDATEAGPDTGPAAGHAACLASHLAVLESHPGPLLVLEDDCCFAADFTLDLDPPGDWDVLWLGGQHKRTPEPVNRVWVRPRYLQRTHAYLVRQPARLAAAARAAGISRMDPYLAQLPGNQYVLAVHTVGQAAGRSDIDLRRTRNIDQFWQSGSDNTDKSWIVGDTGNQQVA